MAVIVTIPDFNFSALHYADILEALMQYKRVNVPELTDESEYEPFVQLLRAFALVGHLNTNLIDLVANEGTLPTSQLVETVRNMLRLIDYEMLPASPGQADLIYELSRTLPASTSVVSENARAATKKEGDDPAVFYEALEALTVEATNAFSYVLAKTTAGYTDYTAKANSMTPGQNFSPWSTPPEVGDQLLFGHKQAMWDTLTLLILTGGTNYTGVWEFYDGDWAKTQPTNVTDTGGALEIDLTSLLGPSNRQGTVVRVMLNETTAYEEVESQWTGLKNVAVVGLLGQTSPSEEESDYTVGSDWSIIEDGTDGTDGMQQSGDFKYALPQSLTQDWKEGTINSNTAYWLRYRVVTVSGGATPPDIDYGQMHQGKQYVKRTVTQGQTKTEVLGSSSGLPNQRLPASQEHFVWGSDSITVDGDAWVRVTNFLSSSAQDKHYTVELTDNDKAVFVFGDGTSGRIPPVGVSNISTTYRHGAQLDGNVGANKITSDKSGLVWVSKVWNPRPAAGWEQAQGSTETSLERAKIEGPATLRTKEVALGPDDLVTLAKRFEFEGSRPFSRARAFEEGYGPKTVALTVVAAGGGQATASQLAALDLYFNGDPDDPASEKHFVANQEVGSRNYLPKTVDIVANVWGNVSAEAIENSLREVVQPEALKSDGVTYEWDFGETVPVSRLTHEIFDTDPSVEKVEITEINGSAPVDIGMGSSQLPVLGTVTLAIFST
jgi:hypothetical protein